MKKIFFLLPEGFTRLSSILLATDVFEFANQYVMSRDGKPYYDIKIVGTNISQKLCNSHVSIKVENINNVERPDLIIIPAAAAENNYASRKNKKLLEWVVDQYKDGTELASLCTGSFLLAATGLFKNMECATHWIAANLFTKMFPNVRLCTDKIITDSKGLYTAGGALSSSNLILYLIEKYNGREVAIYCAKVMHLDIDRNSQSAFIIFEGQKDHIDVDIKKMQIFIEKNADEKITIDYLAEKFFIPKRSLVRRFKKATNNTPIEYIQRIKMEVAKRNLESGRKSVNEIMYE